MIDFNPGDRVRASVGEDGVGAGNIVGTITGPYEGNGGTGRHNGEPVLNVRQEGEGPSWWAYERNIELLENPRPSGSEKTMTDFKPGDRVTVRLGVHAYNDYETGYVREVREGSDGHPRQIILENGHWGYVKNAERVPVYTEPSPFAPAPRPLVGPAPTPPAAPRYVAPFRQEGGFVLDDTGERVASCEWGAHTYAERVEFARYVATALNASVFTED